MACRTDKMRMNQKSPVDLNQQGFSGGGGIRTPGTRKGTSVFKTGAINQTLPLLRILEMQS